MKNRSGQTERVNLVKVNVYCGYMVEDYMPKDPILRFVNETNPDIQKKLEKMTQTVPPETQLFEVKESEIIPLMERLRDRTLELLSGADESGDDDDYYDCIPDWYCQVMMVVYQLMYRDIYDGEIDQMFSPVFELAKKVYPIKSGLCDLDGYIPRDYRGEVNLASLVLTLVQVYGKDRDLFDEIK